MSSVRSGRHARAWSDRKSESTSVSTASTIEHVAPDHAEHRNPTLNLRISKRIF